MKKLIILLGIVLLVMSCTKIDEKVPETTPNLVEVTFNIQDIVASVNTKSLLDDPFSIVEHDPYPAGVISLVSQENDTIDIIFQENGLENMTILLPPSEYRLGGFYWTGWSGHTEFGYLFYSRIVGYHFIPEDPQVIDKINYEDTKQLEDVTKQIRELILKTEFPKEIKEEII